MFRWTSTLIGNNTLRLSNKSRSLLFVSSKYHNENSVDWNKYVETGIMKRGAFSLDAGPRFPPAAVKFPIPQDININMMPFIMSVDFKKTKLPEYLNQYHENIIRNCYFNPKQQEGKIYYLTVQESFVKKGQSQRRPGLHVDCAPEAVESNANSNLFNEGSGLWTWKGVLAANSHFIHPWGMGMYSDEGNLNVDGIFIASTVADSCVVYNCRIIADEEGNEVIGYLGNIEHLRDFMPGERLYLETEKHLISIQGRFNMIANQMYWITDRTPHESLPMKEDGYRQFFRLVTEQVGLWYEQHSTPNPNGVMPDPQITRIVKGNKFGK